MRICFADTSFFVAFLNARDTEHAAAVDQMENFEGRIVTTDWVLVELGNGLYLDGGHGGTRRPRRADRRPPFRTGGLYNLAEVTEHC
jgi:predicted nucleic acid-binding protein